MDSPSRHEAGRCADADADLSRPEIIDPDLSFPGGPSPAAVAISGARWRTLADHSADLIVCWSLDRRRTFVSAVCQSMLGYTPDEVQLLSAAEMIHPDCRALVAGKVDDLIRGVTERTRSTYRIRHKDGHWIWVEAQSSLVRGTDGVPSEVITTIRDMSEHRIAEERRRVEAARAQTLTDALPQMVWIVSSKDDLVATYMNQQFRSFYGPIGSMREERVGRNHPDDAKAMAQAWDEARLGRRSYAVQGRLRRSDGIYRWHQLVLTPVLHEGEVLEWIGTALDIDDIVRGRNELAKTTDLLRLAQQSAGAGVWEWAIGSDIVRHSVASARMHDVEPPPTAGEDAAVVMTLADWKSRVCPEDLPAVWEAVHRAIGSRDTYTAEFRTVDPQGGPRRWLQAFGRIVWDASGQVPLRIVGLHLDVTARRGAEEALRCSEARVRRSEERLALALDSGEEGLWDWNLLTGAVWVSDRWYEMLGYAPDEAAAEFVFWRRTVLPGDARRVLRTMRDHVRGITPIFECEYRMVRKDGRVIWVLARGKVVTRRDDSRPSRIIGTQFQITRRKEAEARVEHLALHDALTGLPNRLLFRQRLSQEFERARTGSGRFAVLCLDLDRFKEINDSLGHLAGDALLKITAERLRPVFRPCDTVARLGGDEFVVILSGLDAEFDPATVARRLVEAVGQPVVLEGRPVHVCVSIGVALGPEDGGDAEALFKSADIALYDAKAGGRNTFRFYEKGMGEAIQARKQLEAALRDALPNGEHLLHYQPVVDVKTKAVVGFEALLRWTNPFLGSVSPAAFIPLSEEGGLIVQLGAWVLLQACREAASWPAGLRVAVNVSAVQFRHPGLEESVIQALAATGLPAARLELEVTESVLMHDSEAVLACLHRLRALGVRIALDDFGTAYSSLSYLRRFPFDKIKVDRSFVADIAEPNTAAIVASIVDLGRRLGITITAEGIETDTQLAIVDGMACDEAQGFLFSAPIGREQIAGYLGGSPVRPAS